MFLQNETTRGPFSLNPDSIKNKVERSNLAIASLLRKQTLTYMILEQLLLEWDVSIFQNERGVLLKRTMSRGG